MKKSEKISLGVLAVVGVIIGGLMLTENRDNTDSQENQVRVPDPIMVPLDQYQAQASDPAIQLSDNAKEMLAKERTLLRSGFDAKIAESQKAIRQAELDIQQAEAELRIRVKEGELMGSNTGGYHPRDVGVDSFSSTDKQPSVVAVNGFRADGSAMVTINGTVFRVFPQSQVAGVTITAIDPKVRAVRYRERGDQRTVYFQSGGQREHAQLPPLASET